MSPQILLTTASLVSPTLEPELSLGWSRMPLAVLTWNWTSPSMKQVALQEIPHLGSMSSRWFMINWQQAMKAALK